MQAPKLVVKGKQQPNNGSSESITPPAIALAKSSASIPSASASSAVVPISKGVPPTNMQSSEVELRVVESSSEVAEYKPDYRSMKINKLLQIIDSRGLHKERENLNDYAKEQFIKILEKDDELKSWDAAYIDYDKLKLKELIDLIDARRATQFKWCAPKEKYNRDGLKTMEEFIKLLKDNDKPRPKPLPPWPKKSLDELRCHPLLSNFQPKIAKADMKSMEQDFTQRDINFFIMAARGYEEGGISVIRKGLAWGIPANSMHSSFEMQPTALMMAAQYNQTEIVELLLRYNADPNYRNAQGWTALHYASRWGMIEVCKILVAAKARVDAKDSLGRTCIDVLESKNVAYPDVYQYLKKLDEELHPEIKKTIDFSKSSLVKRNKDE